MCRLIPLFYSVSPTDHILFIFKMYYSVDVPCLLTGLCSFFCCFLPDICHHLTNCWSVIKNEFKCSIPGDSFSCYTQILSLLPLFTYCLCKSYNLAFYLSYKNVNSSKNGMTIILIFMFLDYGWQQKYTHAYTNEPCDTSKWK